MTQVLMKDVMRDGWTPALAFGDHAKESLTYINWLATMQNADISEWPVEAFLSTKGTFLQVKQKINERFFENLATHKTSAPPKTIDTAAIDQAVEAIFTRRMRYKKEKVQLLLGALDKEQTEILRGEELLMQRVRKIKSLKTELETWESLNPGGATDADYQAKMLDEFSNDFYRSVELVDSATDWNGNEPFGGGADDFMLITTSNIILFDRISDKEQLHFNFGSWLIAVNQKTLEIDVAFNGSRYPDSDDGKSWHCRHPYHQNNGRWTQLCYGEQLTAFKARIQEGDLVGALRITREVMSYFNPTSHGYYSPGRAATDAEIHTKSKWRIQRVTKIANPATDL